MVVSGNYGQHGTLSGSECTFRNTESQERHSPELNTGHAPTRKVVLSGHTDCSVT